MAISWDSTKLMTFRVTRTTVAKGGGASSRPAHLTMVICQQLANTYSSMLLAAEYYAPNMVF
eukprot:6208265-Pleurochrysis_carterae.AAC.1